MNNYIKRLKMNRLLLTFFLTLVVGWASAQTLEGYVREKEGKKLKPVVGANVLWNGTNKGTVTDENGFFEIKKPANKELKLIVSFVGYHTKTVNIKKNQKIINVFLDLEATALSDVSVMGKKDAVSFNMKSIENKVNISKEGIKRLAC